ncbi:T9SS type A sorting domain-containing protein [Catalinimonas niigatensis]|uniref:T9SS type A sorting domain-containing protein n=1 Tax=Catalinimonas niigatensis TaxID=1397264 RepID=UPI00266529A2|nr:T9SS type A sorting domain-containing protein [Catalinimonas niigatensis]WPP48869.1 T9SS type A sorting domain-containing protein [Catalinimonas niigatensis]
MHNTCVKSLLVLLSLISLLTTQKTASAQTGPAGVGNASGTSGQPENIMWLDASDITGITVGDDLNSWLDKSGNGNNLGASPYPGSTYPSLQSTGSFKYLNFLENSDRLIKNPFNGFSNIQISTFIVYRTTDASEGIISYDVPGEGNEYLLLNSSNVNVYINGTGKSTGRSFNNNNWSILSNQWKSDDGRLLLSKNGGIELHSSIHRQGNTISDGGSLAIGTEQDGVDTGYDSNQEFQGDIAEIILYNSFLDAAQRTIVENYLSQKYDIDISNDYLGNALSYNTNYAQDIRGIGSDGTNKRTSSYSSGSLSLRENSNSLDANEYVMLAHNGTAHAISTNNLVGATGVTDRWARDWYVEKNQGGGTVGVNGGDVSVQMVFDFAEAGLLYSGNLSNYVLLYRSTATGDFNRVYADSYTLEGGNKVVVSVPSSRLATGYYTLGTGTPLLAKTWYVFQDGNWSDPNTWTTDASTAPLYKNSGGNIPSAADEVIIRSGRTVTIQSITNNQTVNSIKVDGSLHLTTSTGHNFNTINGSGIIRMAGYNPGSGLADNFPAGVTNGNIGFADADNGGTLVVYAAADINLNTARTFRHMRIELINNTSKAILGANLTLNGDLEVRNGGLQFGDGTTTGRTLSVNGDVLVTNNGSTRVGSISTSTGNATHTFDIKGDFTNNGNVRFTNRADFASVSERRNPSNTYYVNSATDGIVDVFFTNDNASQTVSCNSLTYFYRMVIDKGVDDTYKLTLQADHIDYFRLLGYASTNLNSDLRTVAQNTNAFALINGTAEIGSNVEIPVINRNNNCAISSTTRLWVNGGDVRKTSGTAIVPYGKVQVSAGYLEASVNSGITIRNNGLIIVEGGSVFTKQIRTSIDGIGSLGGYQQSGGTVTVDGGLVPGGVNADYYLFSMTYTGNVFIMSGGTLHVRGAVNLSNPSSPSNVAHGGLIFINSDPGNQNVTGGTVIVESSNTNGVQKITSRAPFYNFTITNSINSTNSNARIIVDGGTSGDNDDGADNAVGTADDKFATLPVQNLIVLNNLTIETGTTRNDGTNTYGSYLDLCPNNNCINLEVGANLTIQDSGVLDIWVWDGTDNDNSATVTFNGTSDGILYVGDITTYTNALVEFKNPYNGPWPSGFGGNDETYGVWVLPFYNLVIDKPDATLSLASKLPGKGSGSPGETASQYKNGNGGKNISRYAVRLTQVTNRFELLSGTLNQVDPLSTLTRIEDDGGNFGEIGDPVAYSLYLLGPDIINHGTCFVYEDGVTRKEGTVNVRASNDLTIQTTEGASFGNFEFNNDGYTLSLSSDVNMGRLQFVSGILDIGTHNLKVDVFEFLVLSANLPEVDGQALYTSSDYIRMAGNKSDGGLSIKLPRSLTLYGNLADYTKEYNIINSDYYADGQEYNMPDRIWFPIGTDASGSNKYTPAVMFLTNDSGVTYSGDEYVTVRVVDGELQTTDLSGGDMLSYYWNVDLEGFDSGVPKVSWLFQYDASDINGSEAAYVPGKVLDGGTYQRSYDGTAQAVKDGGSTGNAGNILGNNPQNIIFFNGRNAGNTLPLPLDDSNDNIDSGTSDAVFNAGNVDDNWAAIFPGTGFTLENANYTAGVATRFVGSPRIYYSSTASVGNDTDFNNNDRWTLSNRWSTVGHFSSTNSGTYPQAGDIAVLGFGLPNATATTDNAQRSHWFFVDQDIEAAALIFSDSVRNQNGVMVARNNSYTPQLTIDNNASVDVTIGTVEGIGTFNVEVGCSPCNADPASASAVTANINADFGLFANEEESRFDYDLYINNNTAVYLPTSFPDIYPNVQVKGQNNTRTLIFQEDITINRDLVIRQQARLRLSHLADGDITVHRNLDFTINDRNEYIEFPNAGPGRTLRIEGDILMKEDDRIVVLDNNNAADIALHRLQVGGNITKADGRIILYNGIEPDRDHAILELIGTSNAEYTSTNNANDRIISMYKLQMNKGTNQDATFTFQENFRITDATSSFQPLEILNGTLVLNASTINPQNAVADRRLLLANGANFFLPNTTNPLASSGSGGLEIRQGIARVSGANTGIVLDGLLRVSGGTLDMDGGTGVNNFIEYSSSGQARLEVTGGTLTLGSQLRRGLNSNTGVLQYVQSGGTVILGKNAAPEATRGVLEVTNSGSYFEHTGGSLTLVRHNNSISIASLLLEPETTNVADGTIITVGNGSTPTNQNRFGIQSNITLSELEIASANITARLYSLPLSTNILDVGTGANFNANGFDLTIYANLNNDGTFATSGNSTNGQATIFPIALASNATITGSGTTNFWNFEKSGGGTLLLSKNVTVTNNTFIYEGTLNTQNSALNIKKDLLHDAIHISAASGPGILFNGTQQQILGRSGPGTSQLGVMNLNNISGLLIRDTDENFQVNGKCILTSGVLDIGGNLLIFSSSAMIENGSGGTTVADFNVNNMIQTNSAIRDFGIRKFFNAVSGGNTTFTYPVGLTAYTPVVVNISDISASNITIRPVKDVPPIAEDAEYTFDGTNGCEDPDITDADNVLQYYWIVKSSGVSGFVGSILTYYDPNDVRVQSPYDIRNYGPARIWNSSDDWDKVFTTSDFNELTQEISFPFTGNGDATLAGIYTAGVTLRNDGTTLLCGAAIPDQVPQFITNDGGGGNFFTGATYTGGVAPVAGETPDITIQDGDALIYNQNSIRTRKITIESGGTLIIQNGTSNHNLGFVTGEGTIRLESNTSSVVFPTGDYEEFFPDEYCNGGGGLEYAGSGNYPVLSDLTNIRRVIFSGSNNRILPNSFSLNVCEDFDIRGTVNVIIQDGNNTTTVRGNIYKSDDSNFDNGGGNSRVVMRGSSPQSIRGDFTVDDAFNELQINNAAGVTIVNAADASRGISANQDVVVDKTLILTNGILITNSDNTLTINNSGTYSGGGPASFVNGPLTKNNIAAATTFQFPIGRGSRYAPAAIINATVGNQNWTAEYFAVNQRDRTVFDPGSGSTALVDISNDMWRITSSGNNEARVRINWNASTGVSDITDTRVVYWDNKNNPAYTSADNDAAQNRWESKGGISFTGNTSAGSVTSQNLLPFSTTDIALGTANVTLPVELLSFSVKMQDRVALLQWVTASEKNNDFFEIQRSLNGKTWTTIGIVKGAGDSQQELSYTYTDKNPVYGVSYYRLRQVDFDAQYEYSNVIVLENVSDDTELPQPEVLLYPNPAQLEKLIIRALHLHAGQQVEVSLSDIYGKQYLYEQVMPEDLEKGISIKQNMSLPNGVYLVSIRQGDIRIQKKLILKE